MNEPTPRRAARLLVIDPQSGAVLLFQYEDGGRRWWATPGGGLDGDETFEEAAIREAVEELAISCRSLLPLWQRTVEFSFRGTAIRQEEQYFLLPVPAGAVALGQRCEKPTITRASSRRGGGRSRKSRPPPNKCFPKISHGACASFDSSAARILRDSQFGTRPDSRPDTRHAVQHRRCNQHRRIRAHAGPPGPSGHR